MSADPVMTVEQALALLSRARDGEIVEPRALAAARARVAGDAAAAAEWRRIERAGDVLAAEPALAAPAGFAGRVLAARREAQQAEAALGPFVRRLAAAAVLALAVTVGWGVWRPVIAAADPGVERARHAVDHFKRGPFEADALDRGIESLLRGEEPWSTPEGPR